MAYSSTKPANGTSLVSADMRENFRALKEDEIVTADGVKALGITEGMLAAASVSQAKLKTSQGSVSSWGMNRTLPGGEYGFYPQFKMADTTSQGWQAALLGSSGGDAFAGWTTYTSNIFLQGGVGKPVYAQQRYVTSSGEVFWIFILRTKYDEEIQGKDVDGVPLSYIRPKGTIISMYQAPDHPCFGNGGKPLVVQHPFGSYDPETQEIVVINPSEKEVTEMKGRCKKGEDEPDKDLLEIITEEYVIDENSSPKWPTKKVTVGLPKDRDYKRDPDDTKVTPIKKVIPQPKGILVKKLRRK